MPLPEPVGGLECDVAVIGAGTAGLEAEKHARAAGARTLLIDDRFAGTMCATVGCMPSKLLLAAAQSARDVQRARDFGLETADAVVNGPAVMQRLRGLRDRFVASALGTIAEVPLSSRVRAMARFDDPGVLALDDGRRVKASAVVIATGSRSVIPKPFSGLGDRVLTNETIFELQTLPKSLAVVGAGPLGLELAQAFVRLGVDVKVFDEGAKIAGLHDEHVARVLLELLKRELPIRLNVELEAACDEGGVRLSWSGESDGEQVFERVLVATGRKPELERLDLESIGLDLDSKGIPLFDATTLQCGDKPVFMAGDVDAARPVLHEAAFQGATAGKNAARFPNVLPGIERPAFSIMFTDPPLAVVGKPEQPDSIVGEVSFADQGRALIEARSGGLLRLYAAKDTGRLTGAVFAGPGADHLGHLLAWAIGRGETAASLLDLPIYHPTYEEGLKTALERLRRA